jgi:hypothetical protein
MRNTLLALVVLAACGPGHSQPDPPRPRNELCGGIAGRQCRPTEYCDFANNQCGAGDQSGICKPRPEVCTLIAGQPICACSGKTYLNECEVYAAGSDLNVRGSCDIPQGLFQCGYMQCDVKTQYCLHEHPASGPDTYSCPLLPASCGPQPASCACLAGAPCGTACSGSATAGLTLTCS